MDTRLDCQWTGDEHLPQKPRDRAEIVWDAPACVLEVSKTEHTVAPEFSDSANGAMPTVLGRGVLNVRK